MKESILEISITTAQAEDLLALVESSTIATKEPIRESLLKTLASQQLFQDVLVEVRNVLSDVSGFAVAAIKETHNLTANLGLSSDQLRSLAVPFNAIISNHGDEDRLTMSDCAKCKTVKDCATLIAGKL
jgi:hypothetical protein